MAAFKAEDFFSCIVTVTDTERLKKKELILVAKELSEEE